MGSQCPQPVKLKMNQNGAPEMFQVGIFRMSWKFRPRCTVLVKFGETLGTPQGNVRETGKLGTF
jgi:hypothetical protein